MVSIETLGISFNRFIEELRGELGQRVSQRLEAQLEAEVEGWLQRGRYGRRQKVGARQIGSRCNRCGTRQAKHFWRNGHRRRQLVTTLGVVSFRLPRVVCDCGGSVPMPFSILAPYQRLWDDVLEQIGRWAMLGLSLRQMQREIGDQLHTQVGLRKLNEVVAHTRGPVDLPFSSVPPVVLLDAIWVTLLDGEGACQPDQLGRVRLSKHRDKVCLLVALGLYPQSGRWGILAWSLADSESQQAWEKLLMPLEARGLYRERGLELFVHDGGAGLQAALNLMYPHLPHQRCLFHKLRNLWQAIRPPIMLTSEQARTFKHALFVQVRAILFADSPDQASQRRDAFCQQWQALQPDLVATLCRDWPQSIAFFRVLARFPAWPRRYLRTTSLLERINRMLRRLFRPAGAYHSPSGLLAAVARVLLPFRLI
jgi:transposase-like protein